MKILHFISVVLVVCNCVPASAMTRLHEHDPIKQPAALNAKAVEFLRSREYDSAKRYAEKSLALQDHVGIDSLKGDAYISLALVYYYHGQYDTAISINGNALRNYEKYQNRDGIARSLINMGILHKKLSNYRLAVQYYYKAAALYEMLHQDEPLSSCWNSMANCYSALEEFQKAQEFNRKALLLRTKLKDARLIAQSLNNIGDVYRELGQYDSATRYLKMSFDYKKTDKDSSSLILLLQNLGFTHFKQKKFEKAEAFYLRAIRISGVYGHRAETALGYNDLAELRIAQARYRDALKALDSAEALAIAMKTPEILKDNYRLRYSMHEKRGQWREALQYRNKYDLLKDSLFTLEKDKAIEELEIRYRTEQKEKDIRALNVTNRLQQEIVTQQRLSIYALTGGLLLLFFLLLVAYSRYRLKSKANKRIGTLMREMHHRVKNNLQMLSGLFSIQASQTDDVNAKMAIRDNEARVEAMNLLHQSLYLGDEITQVNMTAFLDSLLDNLKLSYRHREVEILSHVSQVNLDADKAIPIGLIVNELVSNAYKYAFPENGQKAMIEVDLSIDDMDYLNLIVRDNGKPFFTEKQSTQSKQSFGLSMVSMLTEQLQAELLSSYDGGTVYLLRLKIESV